MVDINVLQSDSKHKENSECPCEDDREMFSDYVVPEVFVNEMV